MASTSNENISMFHLPHSHEQWPKVRDKLKLLADKKTVGSLDAMRDVVVASPYWGLDKRPLLNIFNKTLSDGTHYNKGVFFGEVLPYIARRAVEVESLFPEKTIQLLLSGTSQGVTITRYQASCLLALAFFCLLDKPSKHGTRFQRLSLVEILEYGCFRSQSSKCLCLVGYFDRLRREESSGNLDFLERCITIVRKVLDKEKDDLKFWKECDLPLGEFETSDGRFIESFEGCLQVDFANEYIGGGVLQQGNVQEEIRFVTNPECLVSMLYCETMAPHESILITGAETFSTYSGYGGNFNYTGPYTDPNPVDPRSRCSVDIVAIDAIPAAWLPGGATFQFMPPSILREICKAYCGFSFQACGDSAEGKSCVPVATGNWGCGAFGGNKELKTVVQWVAATCAGRKVCYCTFRDVRFGKRQQEFVKAVFDAKVTVSRVVSIVLDPDYSKCVMECGTFEYVKSKIAQ